MKDNTLVKVLTVEFDHRLKISEIPKFRGAVISTMENAPIDTASVEIALPKRKMAPPYARRQRSAFVAATVLTTLRY